MMMSKRLLAAIFVMLLLNLATEMGSISGAEAARCKARCQTCKGWCTSNSDCSRSCKAENPDWTYGQCQSFPPKCYCVKDPCFTDDLIIEYDEEVRSVLNFNRE